jgi:hypothetical protein
MTVTATGTGTAWVAGTTFSVHAGSPAGAAVVGGSTTVNVAAQTATFEVTTGAGTGTLTITDSKDAATATLAIDAPAVSVSPSAGFQNVATAITLTGTHTLWTQEMASTLFSVSSGSISNVTVTADGTATATLTPDSSASITITDNSTGQTCTFAAAAFSTLLVLSAYKQSHVVTLFGLPKWDVENYFGPGSISTAKLLARLAQWETGGYEPLGMASVTSATVAAFQTATLAYALNQLCPGPYTYTDVELAALFGTTQAAIDTAMGGDGPYTAAQILAATNAGTLTFADITPTTVAAFCAAGG